MNRWPASSPSVISRHCDFDTRRPSPSHNETFPTTLGCGTEWSVEFPRSIKDGNRKKSEIGKSRWEEHMNKQKSRLDLMKGGNSLFTCCIFLRRPKDFFAILGLKSFVWGLFFMDVRLPKTMVPVSRSPPYSWVESQRSGRAEPLTINCTCASCQVLCLTGILLLVSAMALMCAATCPCWHAFWFLYLNPKKTHIFFRVSKYRFVNDIDFSECLVGFNVFVAQLLFLPGSMIYLSTDVFFFCHVHHSKHSRWLGFISKSIPDTVFWFTERLVCIHNQSTVSIALVCRTCFYYSQYSPPLKTCNFGYTYLLWLHGYHPVWLKIISPQMDETRSVSPTWSFLATVKLDKKTGNLYGGLVDPPQKKEVAGKFVGDFTDPHLKKLDPHMELSNLWILIFLLHCGRYRGITQTGDWWGTVGSIRLVCEQKCQLALELVFVW